MQHISNQIELIEHELFLVPGVLDIGRASENHIQLDDVSISSYHAKIVTYFHESFIIDLDSSNGIYLNGKRVYKHSLKVGDKLQVGNYYLVIKPAKDWFMCEPVMKEEANTSENQKAG